MSNGDFRTTGAFTLDEPQIEKKLDAKTDEPQIEKKLDAKTCEAIVENFHLALKKFVESDIGFTNGGWVKKNDND